MARIMCFSLMFSPCYDKSGDATSSGWTADEVASARNVANLAATTSENGLFMIAPVDLAHRIGG